MTSDPFSKADFGLRGPESAGDEAASESMLGVVEADIRRLIKEVAEARFAAEQADREHRDFTRKLFLELLDVLDAFDRVFADMRRKPEHITAPVKIWMGNFRTVRRLVDIVLRERGVTRIENAAGEFDPHWHRATETVVDPSKADGTIVEETQPGYTWRNELLRKAEVIVARSAPEPDGADDSDTGA
jgi:molecular chaperone GrpE